MRSCCLVGDGHSLLSCLLVAECVRTHISTGILQHIASAASASIIDAHLAYDRQHTPADLELDLMTLLV